ncbi:MAG: potassium/proton antiporter [Actinomycetota bacterium]|nr:potassium/proton antiporter [Actinomycetota bacterium]
MTLDGLAAALLVGAAIVLVSIVGARFAGRLGVPGLLLYLLLGLVLGASFPVFAFDDAQLATVLGYSALVLILAQGGLTTRLSQLRPVMWPALTLATLGVLVSITVVAIPLVLLMDVAAQPAILIGAVLAATDAAAVFAVMRRMRIGSRVRSLLEAEAGFNDAPVVVLVSVVASGSFGSDPWWLIPIIVAVELVGGAAVGIAFGYSSAWLLRRIALPAVGLYPIAALALLVASYGLADFIHVSGFMAVYVAAVLLGSAARLPHRRSIVGFADGLSWIAEIGLFVMLGLLASVSRLPAAVPMALGVAVILVVLARPLAAIVSLAPYRWPRNAIAFASVAGLRGAVPIVFAAIPLAMGMPEAEMVFDVTLIVVLVLALVQTPALPAIGRRLGVVLPEEAIELDVESAPLDGMHASVLGIEIPAGSGFVGTFVSEIGLPEGAVVSLVIRGNTALAPDAHTRVRAGDRVLIVATEEARNATEERIRAVARGGRLARWLKD